MGSCCGSKPNHVHHVQPVHHAQPAHHLRETHHEPKRDHYKLPKIIVIPEDAALIYLDPSPTSESVRLKDSLKRKFPNLIMSDSDKRIVGQVQYMKERKHYIVAVGNIRDPAMRSLLRSHKVRAIYFALEQAHLDAYTKSHKIKGLFHDSLTLKKAIYQDVRSDEFY